MTIAILGTGNVGANLGVRLASSGQSVIFAQRGDKDLTELVSRSGARSAPLADACAEADVLILAVPSHAAVDVLARVETAGKILVDCTNPVGFPEGAPIWTPPAEGSVTAALAAAYPDAHVVKAFSTFGAAFHAEPHVGGRGIDNHIAGDDEGAKTTVANLSRKAGFTPVDVGPLRNAALLEAMAVLWIHLAHVGGHGPSFAFQMVGRA